MQFLGNIEAKVDAKARVFVPASFRKMLLSMECSDLVIRKDIFQNCLTLYPISVWNEEVNKLRTGLNRWDKKQQHVFRQFVSEAERLEMDASGRILIPRRCLQSIGVESDIRFLGVGCTIELWAKGEFESTLASSDDFGAEIQRLMSEGHE